MTIWAKLDRAAGGLAFDLGLYSLSAVFALVTAATSTLLPHRAWGAIAAVGYAAATLAVITQLIFRHRPTISGTACRAALAGITWLLTAWVPMLVQAAERAGGRLDRAQEEVLVVEDGGVRLLHHGTPFLSDAAIAALPADERLLGYMPYQPGMALFGIPHAIGGTAWWTDARVWFALATLAALAIAVRLLLTGGASSAAGSSSAAWSGGHPAGPALVRALQLSTVLPVCALTLATGGDDIPVLALCLLAIALCATGRFGWAGVAAGLAAALKLFAWPAVAVLLVLALVTGRRAVTRFAPGALLIPVVALIPPALIDPGALFDNVIGFPLGHGVVTSPAASPLPGYLIAQALPGGKAIAAALLAIAALVIVGWMVKRPPRTAAAAAAVIGWGLLAAMLLMPSTRFGYLLYPVAFLAWSAALTRHRPVFTPVDRPPVDGSAPLAVESPRSL